MTQQQRCEKFQSMHRDGNLLVLPNIWDPLGALLLEHEGFPAAATASASVAFANGYDDGEHIPFPDLLALLTRICTCVRIPLSADVESGFATTLADLRKNAHLLLDTGIAGINLEDTEKSTGRLYPAEQQCERIAVVRQVAAERSLDLFINARTDVYLRDTGDNSPESKLVEAIGRGKAYLQAGASGIFPIALKNQFAIRTIVSSVSLPVNISLLPEGPSLNELSGIGVARVSMGPSLLRYALRAMLSIAERLKNHEGEPEMTGNEISTAFLKGLVTGNE